MKVIDILIMRSKNEDMPKEIIVKGKTHHYKFKKENDINYIDNEGDYLFSCEYNWFNMLNYDVEIVEQPKEDLEEIELLKREVSLSISESQSYINHEIVLYLEKYFEKINEIIEKQFIQNKIIRELKANKGNE